MKIFMRLYTDLGEARYYTSTVILKSTTNSIA